MSRVPDGPLHDFGSEAAHARAEAIDRQVDEWSQDAAEIELTLRHVRGLSEMLADVYDYNDEYLGAQVRLIVSRALTARAEREIDA